MIDPIGALLAVLMYEFIIAGSTGDAFGHTLLFFVQQIMAGLLLGALSGYALGVILRRHWLPEYLRNMATLMVVLGVFALSDSIRAESGWRR